MASEYNTDPGQGYKIPRRKKKVPRRAQPPPPPAGMPYRVPEVKGPPAPGRSRPGPFPKSANTIHGVGGSKSQRYLARAKKQQRRQTKKQLRINASQILVKNLLKQSVRQAPHFTDPESVAVARAGDDPRLKTKRQKQIATRTSKAISTLLNPPEHLTVTQQINKQEQATRTLAKYKLLPKDPNKKVLFKPTHYEPGALDALIGRSTKGASAYATGGGAILQKVGQALHPFLSADTPQGQINRMGQPDIQRAVSDTVKRGLLQGGGGVMEAFDRTAGFGITAATELAAKLGSAKAKRLVKKAPGAFDVITEGRGKYGISGGDFAQSIGLPKEAGIAFEIGLDPTTYVALMAAPVTGGTSLSLVLADAAKFAKAGRLGADGTTLVAKYAERAAKLKAADSIGARKLQKEFLNDVSKRSIKSIEDAPGVRVMHRGKKGDLTFGKKHLFGSRANEDIQVANELSMTGRQTRPGIRLQVGNPLAPGRKERWSGITLPVHHGIRKLKLPGRKLQAGGKMQFEWGRTLGEAMDQRVNIRTQASRMNLGANQSRSVSRRGDEALKEAFAALPANPTKRDESLERIWHVLTAKSDGGQIGEDILAQAVELNQDEWLVVNNWRNIMNELARGGIESKYLHATVNDYIPRYWNSDHTMRREIEGAVNRPGSVKAFRQGRTLPNVVNAASMDQLTDSIMKVATKQITREDAAHIAEALHETSKYRSVLEVLARRIQRGVNPVYLDELGPESMHALRFDQLSDHPLFRHVESPATEGRVLLTVREQGGDDFFPLDPNMYEGPKGDLERLFSADGDYDRINYLLERLPDPDDPYYAELEQIAERLEYEIDSIRARLTPEDLDLVEAWHGTRRGERPWFAGTGVDVDYNTIREPIALERPLANDSDVKKFTHMNMNHRVPFMEDPPWKSKFRGSGGRDATWMIVYQPKALRQPDEAGLQEFWLTREEASKFGDDLQVYRVRRSDVQVDLEALNPERPEFKHRVLINTSRGAADADERVIEALNAEGYPLHQGFHVGSKEAALDRIRRSDNQDLHPMYFDPSKVAGPEDLPKPLRSLPSDETVGPLNVQPTGNRFVDPDAYDGAHLGPYHLFPPRAGSEAGASTPAEELMAQGYQGIRYENTVEGRHTPSGEGIPGEESTTSIQFFQREGSALDEVELRNMVRHGDVFKNEDGIYFIGPKNVRETKYTVPEGVPPRRTPYEAGPFDSPYDPHDIGGILEDVRREVMPETNLARIGSQRMKAEGITAGQSAAYRTIDDRFGRNVDDTMEHSAGNYYQDKETGQEYIRLGEGAGQLTVDVTRYGVDENRLWPVEIVDTVNHHMLSYEGKTDKFLYQSGLETGLEKILGSVRWGVTVPFPAYHIRNMISDLIKSIQADSGVMFHPIVNARMLGAAYGFGLAKRIDVPNIGKMRMEDFLLWADMFGVRSNQHFAEFAQLIKGGALTGNRLPKRAVNKLTQWGASREDVMRYATFTQALRRNGGDAAEAMMMTIRHHFDYNDLKGYERRWLRNVFLFYTWYRKNIPLQLVELGRRPGFFAGIAGTYRSLEAGETPISVGPFAGVSPPIQAMAPYLRDKLQAAKLSWKEHAMTVGFGAPWADLQWLSAEGSRDLLTILNPVLPLGYALREKRDPLTGRPYQSNEVSGLSRAIAAMGIDLPTDTEGNPTLPWWVNVVGRNIPLLGRGTSNLTGSSKSVDQGAFNEIMGYLSPLTGLNVKVHPLPETGRAKYNIANWIAGRANEYREWQIANQRLPGKSPDITKKPHKGRYLQELKKFNLETVREADRANVPRHYLKEIIGLPQYLSKEDRGITRKRKRTPGLGGGMGGGGLGSGL